MKVLFVCSGNKKPEGPGTVVKNQGDTLIAEGIQLEYFLIRGRGYLGYLKNVRRLRATIKRGRFDIIHAHYSDSAYLASISGAKPLVVSLMGSDVMKKSAAKIMLRLFSNRWNAVIAKSSPLAFRSGLSNTRVIPNGVDLDKFTPIDGREARKALNWDENCRHIVFLADPARPEKNYVLAKEAFGLIKTPDLRLHVVHNVPHDTVKLYYYGADVILMTSLYEGSPNVVKEAIACNCPIVSTPVGDVMHLLEGIRGCAVTTFEPKQVAQDLQKILNFRMRTNGREKLIEKGLDARSVALKIIEVYKRLIRK